MPFMDVLKEVFNGPEETKENPETSDEETSGLLEVLKEVFGNDTKEK